jgi:hypothetical protein
LTPGIASLAIGSVSGTVSLGNGTLFTNATLGDTDGGLGNSGASLVITEGFASAWRTQTQESNSGVALAGSGTQIELTFTGIPSGVTLTLSLGAASKGLGTPTLDDTVLTSAANDNDVTITLPVTDLTKAEQIQINIDAAISGTTTSLTAGSITVVADLAPVGAVLNASDRPSAANGYPVFAAAPTASVTAYNIIAARTSMLVPYVVSDGTFDTGITIANTTADPWSGSGGAVAGSGTLTFYLYPRTATGAGTMVSLTTGATVTPGVGLGTDGTLASGGTYSVLLSEVLTAAGQSGSFTGYVFITSNFILGHGTSFVFGPDFTSASPVMVVPQTQTTARAGFESLGF